ncbi:ataxin-2-like protein isoform X2 [Oppia nitens]|uniref:ataxin-2-like protein isoform X2 n=1 Tax=Oppia nitens TaxID=1686743 RepID=UPI0023D9B8FE|nr:ataxin-2-like protein isoform X2 [Oppia nitens]
MHRSARNTSTGGGHSHGHSGGGGGGGGGRPPKDRAQTPEGVYHNGRLMHCTTSLVGCLVHIECKDGTKYEGVLRTFSPDFELVIDYVTKVDANTPAIIGSNIGTLLASLEANYEVSPRVIFQFADVVKLHAINVDLNFATNKGHMLTDTEISRFDAKQLNRDRELVPWDGGAGDSGDDLDLECDHNGSTQNGWDPDDMFRTNETKFQVKSNFNPNLDQYTCALPTGEGEEFAKKERMAQDVANDIESEPIRTDRYAKEDADDEDKYSSVIRTTDNNNQQKMNRNNNQMANPRRPNSSGVGTGGGGGGRGGGSGGRNNRSVNSNASMGSSPAFHSPKSPNYPNSKQFSNNSNNANMTSSYKSQEPSSVSTTTAHIYSKSEVDDHSSSTTSQTNSITQRNTTIDGRRPANNRYNKKDDMNSGDMKLNNDFKLSPNNAELHKDTQLSRNNESQSKHTNASVNSGNNTANTSAAQSVKNKLPVNIVNSSSSSSNDVTTTHVKDKPIDTQQTHHKVNEQTPVKEDKQEKSDSSGGDSGGGGTEVAKKSTLNPNAKTFTPRSPMSSINPSATPPSVASTPSSTVSIPPQHQTLTAPVHTMQQQQTIPVSGVAHGAQRFQSSLVQLPPQYNVLQPGITLPLGHNQYLMTNIPPSMTPTYSQQPNANQSRNYRSKGPQQYTHGVRHDFTQQSAHVAAAVTGHPVLATAPISAPQQIPVTYGHQQQTTMVAQQAPPQHMYQHMYQQFHPRMSMNVMPQHTAQMTMGVPQAVQYDATQLQHLYAAGAVQLQHMVQQQQPHQHKSHQHMGNSGGHSGHSTPQSATPTTPLHGNAPTPSPVHHQPNQPPTPTPQQTVMYANVAQGHNPNNQTIAHHSGAGATYHNIVLLPTSHHSGPHGGPHSLVHSSSANHHNAAGPGTTILPVQLITNSQAQQQNSYNTNTGV